MTLEAAVASVKLTKFRRRPSLNELGRTLDRSLVALVESAGCSGGLLFCAQLLQDSLDERKGTFHTRVTL